MLVALEVGMMDDSVVDGSAELNKVGTSLLSKDGIELARLKVVAVGSAVGRTVGSSVTV